MRLFPERRSERKQQIIRLQRRQTGTFRRSGAEREFYAFGEDKVDFFLKFQDGVAAQLYLLFFSVENLPGERTYMEGPCRPKIAGCSFAYMYSLNLR